MDRRASLDRILERQSLGELLHMIHPKMVIMMAENSLNFQVIIQKMTEAIGIKHELTEISIKTGGPLTLSNHQPHAMSYGTWRGVATRRLIEAAKQQAIDSLSAAID